MREAWSAVVSTLAEMEYARELAATYPPGYRGDPDAESDRRPGTD